MNILPFKAKADPVKPTKRPRARRRSRAEVVSERLLRKTAQEERDRQSAISNRVSGLISAIIHLSELQGDPSVAIDELAFDENFYAHLVPVAEQAGRKIINEQAEKASDWLQKFVTVWRDRFPVPDNVVRLRE